MPKYHYRCESCTRDWWEWNSISESDIEECPSCGCFGVVKIPTNFAAPVQSSRSTSKKVGDVTKEHIEKNREMLKQMKEEASHSEWTPDD